MTRGHSISVGSRCFFVMVALCAMGLLQACGGTEKEPEPVVTVQVEPVKRGPIEETVSADAVIFPLQQAVLTPKITSTIRKFYVQRGSRVKQGQLLAALENADLSAAAEQSKGELEQAQAGYATTTGASLPEQIQKAELDAAVAKSAFDAQQKVYDSRKELFDQGAIPRRDLDSAEVALAQARSQNEQAQKQLADLNRLGKEQALKAASGQLSATEGKYRNAEAQLSYSFIRSPIDGVVTDRPQYEGELAAANQPLLTVMNTSKLIAKAHISENEALQLKVGGPAELHLAGIDEPIRGKVSLVSPALDPGSTTIEVWIEVTKPPPALKPGMNVSIEAMTKRAKDALIVPRSSVLKTPEGSEYVMLAGSDGKAHQTDVKVGIANKEFAQVLSGVKEGDAIITVGGYALPDKTKITIERSAAAQDNGEDAAGRGNRSDPGAGDKNMPTSPAKDTE
jgi:multidrug efflux pump subunit AcrA (membrane-fusion protein)